MPKPNVLAAFAIRFCQRNSFPLCKGSKLQNSAFAEFWDCLPVFALECFSANETGVFFPNSAPLNSGLWLGAFGKVWLFRCQSRSFRPTLLPLETPVLPTAVCKSSRIRHSPNSGTVCRFPVLPTLCAKTPEFGFRRILGLFAGFRLGMFFRQ